MNIKSLTEKEMQKECDNMNKIVELAQELKVLKNLSYIVQELQRIELDKMFPTDEVKNV